MFQLCTPRLRCLCSVSLQAAAFEPHLGSSSGPHVGKLYPGDYNLQPEGRASQYVTGHFCTSGFLGGGQGPCRDPQRISRNRDTPQVWYQVLKLLGFALFQSRFRLASFNKTITIACVVCLRVCLFLKTCIYSTLDMNQGTGV